uniref:Uncharacterized protein n=1 Tax=Arion vulgaris TaxID=1028688 RepID=A0A0B6Y772_9EUPU
METGLLQRNVAAKKCSWSLWRSKMEQIPQLILTTLIQHILFSVLHQAINNGSRKNEEDLEEM